MCSDENRFSDNYATAEAHGVSWKFFLATAGLATVVAIAYFDTFRSLVEIWLGSETFHHGFIIFPISIFLIWRKWPILKQIEPVPYLPGTLSLVSLAFLWLMAELLGIQVGKHFAVVMILPAIVVTVMGVRWSRAIMFPLFYLVFAVPFGQGLIPYLIDFTATFTVKALSITGIPVFRDGRFFSIPSGNFEVAKACSGVRYLLATAALGTLFGFLTYQSYLKRTVFFAFSLVLPIVANGFRAYGIVLLAYYSDMKIAVGVDHLIYGWVFFGIVIAALFYVGNRYRDPEENNSAPIGPQVRVQVSDQSNWQSSLLLVMPLAIVFCLLGPTLRFALTSMPTAELAESGMLPNNIPGWSAEGSYRQVYKPKFLDASRELYGRYVSDDGEVNVAVIQYSETQQGAELANSENLVVDTTIDWQIGNVTEIALGLPSAQDVSVFEVEVSRFGTSALIWYWYSVDGHQTKSDLQIKIREARSLFAGMQSISTATIIAAPVLTDAASTRALLDRFLILSYESIGQCLSSKQALPECGVGWPASARPK